MKYRILFLMHMPPPVHGAAMMGKYIHDNHIINNNFDCHHINMMMAKNIDDIGKFRIGKIIDYIQLLYKIIRSLIKIRPDLVYVTPNAKGKAFYKDFIIVQLLKLFRRKIVIHYHNKGVALRQNKVVDNFLYKIFFRHLKVILLADCLYSDINKYVDRENVYICPNGIPEQREWEKTEHKEFNILFLSNMMRDKGVFTLLDACKLLRDKSVDFHCHFVGKWSDINEYDFSHYVEVHGLSSSVTVYGPKYGYEKNEIWNFADVFVLPTYYNKECFPLVLLEAMQHHLPCIATDEGGISDIIDDGKTGFIIEKKNSKELAEKIEFLITHPEERENLGNAGYIKFKSNFAIEIFNNRILSILKDLLK